MEEDHRLRRGGERGDLIIQKRIKRVTQGQTKAYCSDGGGSGLDKLFTYVIKAAVNLIITRKKWITDSWVNLKMKMF